LSFRPLLSFVLASFGSPRQFRIWTATPGGRRRLIELDSWAWLVRFNRMTGFFRLEGVRDTSMIRQMGGISKGEMTVGIIAVD